MDIQDFHQLEPVVFNGLRADFQKRAGFLGIPTCGEVLENLALADCQSFQRQPVIHINCGRSLGRRHNRPLKNHGLKSGLGFLGAGFRMFRTGLGAFRACFRIFRTRLRGFGPALGLLGPRFGAFGPCLRPCDPGLRPLKLGFG